MTRTLHETQPPFPSAGRNSAYALAAIVALWACAAAVWPLTGTVVPWDSKNHFYPMLRYLGAALQHGELPLWNPYHFSGHPAVADPQSLLFTPTMMLFGWLSPQPTMQLFDLVVFAHLLPGALAFVPLFRRRGWHPVGAVAAAIVFMLGGSASARLQHTGIIFSYGFFPLALWFLEEALDRRSYRWGVAFAVTAALMTVGRDQVAFLCALTLIAAVAHRAVLSNGALAYLKQRAGLLAVMALIGSALLAVPSLLTMQFLMTSNRPSFGFGVAAMGSLPPESLATFLFGNVFGSLRWTYDYWGPDWHSLQEGTWTDRAINYLYVGTIPALFVLWHGLAGARLFAREIRFFLFVACFALLYALGRYTPGFGVIFDHFPGVKLYRRPADATFLLNIAIAFLVGYLVHRYATHGAPRWADMRSRVLRIALPAGAVFLVASAVACALVFSLRAGQALPAVREMGFGLLFAAGAMALLSRASGRPWQGAAVAALVLVSGGELIARHAASALNAEPADRYAVFQQLPPEQLRGLQILKQELAERNAKGEHPRIEILGLAGAWQNASMVLGLEDTIGYNPLRIADYERAVGPGENAVDPNLRQFPATFRGYKCRLANLLGLEYLVLDRPITKLPRHFPRLTGVKLLYGSGQMWIYRLEASSPRVYVAHRVVPVDSEAVLDQDELPDFDRATEALVDDNSMKGVRSTPSLSGPEADTVAARARITAYGRNFVEVDVSTDHTGVLVLHDIFYPGWEVYVDGEQRPLLRANLLFRGVEITPGHHRVEFRFDPLSFENLLSAATELLNGADEKEIMRMAASAE